MQPWGGRTAITAVTAFFCVLLVAGCGATVAAGPQEVSAAPSAATSPTSTPTPTATALDGRRGAPPTRIAIPDIRVDSVIQPVGAPERVLEIPAQPWVVGWWRDGVGAGAGAGTVVLVAHLDSREYGKGPFVRAIDLQAGAPMTLTDDSGVERNYRVASVETFRKEVLPYQRLFDQSGPARVVIVTCGGEYDRDAGGWNSNVVVTFAAA